MTSALAAAGYRAPPRDLRAVDSEDHVTLGRGIVGAERIREDRPQRGQRAVRIPAGLRAVARRERSLHHDALPVERPVDLVDLEGAPLVVAERHQLRAGARAAEDPGWVVDVA